MEKLSTFDMENLHEKEKDNVVVDALSQKNEDVTTYVTLVVILDWLDDIQTEYAKDPYSCSIIKNINKQPNFYWHKGRIYLSLSSKFKIKDIKESHNSHAIGHVGFFKRYYNTRQSYYWKEMGR